MVDCLKNPGGDGYPTEESASTEKTSAGTPPGGEAGGDAGGEVVVRHYYQQHYEYSLKVAVLETMNRLGHR